MRNTVFEIISDFLIIALSIILFMIGVIDQIRYTEYVGQEPNSLVLVAEFVMSILVFTIGVNRLLTETTRDFFEITGDLILTFGGLILFGMFLTILITSRFYMYQIEPVFLITRLLISILIFSIGVNRLINDFRS